MAVTGYDINSIRNEMGVSNADLGYLGTQWFGRSACNIGEFYGRSWIKTFNFGVGASPGSVVVSIPDRGNTTLHWLPAQSSYVPPNGGGESSENNYWQYQLGYIGINNDAAWSSFSYVTGPAGTFTKAQFTWNGSFWQRYIGQGGAGTYQGVYAAPQPDLAGTYVLWFSQT